MCLICSTLSFLWKIHRSNVFTFKAIFNDFCFVIIWTNFSRRFKKRCCLTDQAPGRLRVYLGQKLLYNFDSHLKWIVLNSFNKYCMILVQEYWYLDSLKRNKTSLVQSWLQSPAWRLFLLLNLRISLFRNKKKIMFFFLMYKMSWHFFLDPWK